MYSHSHMTRDRYRERASFRWFIGATALASAAYALVCMVAPPASATPVTYEFIPGSSITWEAPDGTTSAVSGEFTYDATTGALSAVNVTLTGTKPQDVNYNLPMGSPGPAAKRIPVLNAAVGYVVLAFTAPLAGVSDALDPTAGASEYCLFCGSGGAVGSASASGEVTVVPTAVTEPSSVAALAAAFGLFLLSHRALRRPSTE